MSDYELSPEARDDVQESRVWIAQDDPVAADKLEADVYAACERLATNPRLGHKRPDLTDERVLFWTVQKQYLVVHAPDMKPLKIVRILHGARDVSSELR
jgi:plasmid stabilization system protein ParE